MDNSLVEVKKQVPSRVAAALRAIREAPPTVILADCSGSMANAVGAKRAIDVVQEALDAVLPTVRKPILLAFHSDAVLIDRGQRLPEPGGGTALHSALGAAKAHKPQRCVVLSDGFPDCENAALEAARSLGCPIDVLYCGAEGDAKAIAFMRCLAEMTGGRFVVRDVAKYKTLTAALKTLALPAPDKGGRANG